MNRFNIWITPYFDEQGYAWSRAKSQTFCREYIKCDRCYGWRCFYPENLKLGVFCDIGCFSLLNAKYGIEIGEETQIGSHCSIYSEDTENNKQGQIKIGKNCLIGSHTLILPNCTIPDNTKIPAYSIVMCDIVGKTIVMKLRRDVKVL